MKTKPPTRWQSYAYICLCSTGLRIRGRVNLKPPVDPEKARAKVNRRIAQALHGQPDYDPFNALILIRAE
jgi:hypothetical protein